MGYVSELRTNWRPLLAAMIGLSSGMSIIGTITNIMAPHFMQEFGWTKEEFAYVNSLSIFTFIMLPIAGRLADVIGVRRTALIGVFTLPVTFVLVSMMTGDIRQYIALFLVQAGICITTTITVYSRLVVQYIEKSRGLALGILGASPYLVSLLASLLLNRFVIDHGWRAGYQALAAILFTSGLLALLMAPPERKEVAEVAIASLRSKRRGWHDYPMIARQPAFWVLLAAMVLINLPQTIAIAQLGLVALDNGIKSAEVGFIISAFSAGVLAGRLLCGIALDHMRAHLVALFSMILPSIGLFLLASSFDSFPAVLTAVLLLGFAFGAEGDIVAFLVVRIFGVEIYSSVMGLMTAAISMATSTGAWLSGVTLRETGNYTLFLTITGTTVFLGAMLFLLLPAASRRTPRLVMAGAE
jgi:MFS family permease